MHVGTYISTSFFYIAEWHSPLYGFTTFVFNFLFTTSISNEYLTCIYFWSIRKDLGINVFINIFCRHMFSFPLGMNRNRIVGSYGNYMFNSFRNCQIIFQRWFIISNSHLQWMKVLISLHPCQHIIYLFY